MSTQDPRHPAPDADLRYISANGLASDVLNLDRRDITNAAGESLGSVDGFLVDPGSGTPEYIVVDAGGFLRTRRYLLPVEQARLDAGSRRLTADLDRSAIERFPELDDDTIESLRRSDLVSYRGGVARACCPDDEDLRRLEFSGRGDDTGGWWSARSWIADAVPGAPTSGAFPVGDERVAGAAAFEPSGVSRDETRTVPAPGERAQPGDVLGIESDGETTALGDTAEDENRRREAAEAELRETARDERER